MVAARCIERGVRLDVANECSNDVPCEGNETGDGIPDGNAKTRIDIEAQ